MKSIFHLPITFALFSYTGILFIVPYKVGHKAMLDNLNSLENELFLDRFRRLEKVLQQASETSPAMILDSYFCLYILYR